MFSDNFGGNFTNIMNDTDNNYKSYVVTETKPVDVPEPVSTVLIVIALMLIIKLIKLIKVN